MYMTVLASGSKGNSTVIASRRTRVLVDAGLSCRELLRRMAIAGEDPGRLDAILITHEHQDHVAGLAVLARRLGIPVYITEQTHRAWVRMLTPRTTMTYAKWLEQVQREKLARAEAAAGKVPTYAAEQQGEAARAAELESIASISAEAACLNPVLNRSADADAGAELPLEAVSLENDCGPSSKGNEKGEGKGAEKANPAALPAVEFFEAGRRFTIGDLTIDPFTIPHDAADPCGFVFEADGIRMAVATDLGYVPPNVKSALRGIDVLLLESNHDLEMLRDGPYPWSVKQRVLSRVGHLSIEATADFLQKDYDGGAAYIVLGHLSESNNMPELARLCAERAVGDRMRLLGNRIVLALQAEPLAAIEL